MWLKRQAAVYDVSLQAVADLREQGYDTVRWNSQGATDSQAHLEEVIRYNDPAIVGDVRMCQDWNGNAWDINDFINESDAWYNGWAICGRSHPGDKTCILEVTGEGKEPMRVNTMGVI